MNAVATPPKEADLGELRVTPAQASAVQPEWKSLLACLLNDLREVSANVAEIADKMIEDEPTIGRLLDSALDDLRSVIRSLDVQQLYRPTTDAAYLTLFKPLAYLQGASSMTKALEVDIFSGAIDKATALLDEAHNGLDGEALGRLLPKQPHGEDRPGAALETERLGWRQTLAMIDARHASGAWILSQWVDHADSPVGYGLVTLFNDLGAAIEREYDNTDWDDNHGGMFVRLSNNLLQVQEVARLVAHDQNDDTVFAAVFLLEMCKQIADEFMEQERDARMLPAGSIVHG